MTVIGYNVEDLNFAFDITQFTSASVFYIKYCPKLWGKKWDYWGVLLKHVIKSWKNIPVVTWFRIEPLKISSQFGKYIF